MNYREHLIKVGVIKPSAHPVVSIKCRCGAEFETRWKDKFKACGNCQHPTRRKKAA